VRQREARFIIHAINSALSVAPETSSPAPARNLYIREADHQGVGRADIVADELFSRPTGSAMTLPTVARQPPCSVLCL
jgi:hypothetical protein